MDSEHDNDYSLPIRYSGKTTNSKTILSSTLITTYAYHEYDNDYD